MTHPVTPYPSQQQFQPTSISSVTAIEAHLRDFIQWTLHITAAGTYSSNTALELLDQAWNAQKLLWQLQEQKRAVFSAPRITH